MSGWKLLTRSLYDKGGGPLPRAAFETHECGNYALERAKAYGLIQFKRRAYFAEWELTQLGRDWCEGRATIHVRRKGWQVVKKPERCATWLAALPRCAV